MLNNIPKLDFGSSVSPFQVCNDINDLSEGVNIVTGSAKPLDFIKALSADPEAVAKGEELNKPEERNAEIISLMLRSLKRLQAPLNKIYSWARELSSKDFSPSFIKAKTNSARTSTLLNNQFDEASQNFGAFI